MERRKAIKRIVKVLLTVCLVFGLMQVVQANVKADTVTLTVERFVLGKGFIMEPAIVEINPGETYADLISRALKQNSLAYDANEDSTYGFYLQGIRNVDVGADVPVCVQNVLKDNNITLDNNKDTPHLKEFSYTSYSGWMYYVNNNYVDGMSSVYPVDNDAVRLMFTLCYGADVTGTASADLTGGAAKEYYKTADKSELIRVMGRANAERTRWEGAAEFADAYDYAMAIMQTVNSVQNDVDEAAAWLKEIESILPEPSKEVTQITLDNSEITLSLDDKTQKITYALWPSDAVSKVTWRSDNTGIAKVDSSGTVTAVAVGETDIHAVTENGYEATCHVTITPSLKNEFLAGTPKVSAKAVAYNSVTVNWDAYTNAEKYVVCRRTAGSSTWNTLSEVTGTSYTDKTAEPGINYYYAVKAASSKWGQTVYSKFKTDLTIKTALGKTTLTNATAPAYNQVKITWGKVAGASGYRIMRAESSKGSYKEIAKTGTTTSYIDKSKVIPGKTYYYKVSAYRTVNGSKVYSTESSVKSAKPAIAKAKATVTAQSKKAVVKWSKVNGASGYEFYYATSKNGSYKMAKRITKSTTVSFTHSKLKKGKTYYYKVRAYRTVDGQRVYGAYSNIKGKKIK